jgi:hypothetical protein
MTEQAVAVSGESVTVPAGFRPCGIRCIKATRSSLIWDGFHRTDLREDVMRLPAAALAVVPLGFPSL